MRRGIFDRLYQRLGVRYFGLAIVCGGVDAFLGFTITVLVLVSYGDDSLAALPGTLAIAAGVYLLLGMFVLRRILPGIRPAIAWVDAGRPAEGAEEAWRASVTWIPRSLPVVFLLGSFGGLPAVLYAVDRHDLGVAAVPVFWLGGQIGLAVTCLHLLFVGEAWMRPVIRDAAAAGALHAPLPRSPWSLRRKLTLALAVTTAFTALAVGAVADSGGSTVGRILLATAVAIGITLALIVPVIRAIADSVAEPVRELSAGTERVAAGDLDAPVPVITTDELGALASRFNVMLEGLKDRELLREQLRESRARIVASSDAARRQVERDLHDGAQQDLVLLKLKLGLVEKEVAGNAPAAALVGEARENLARAMEQLRDLAHGIYPLVLESEGLPGALRDAAERTAIAARLECDGAGRYEPELEAAVYFCCLEALQNASKHAGEGASAAVRLQADDDALVFEVVDDGLGYDAGAVEPGAGVQNMADRIGALGGELRIESAPGRGTTVHGSVPVRT